MAVTQPLRVKTTGLLGKCLQCLIEIKLLPEVPENGDAASDAITLAPSWQNTTMGPQTMVACIPVPTCYKHLTVERKSGLDLSTGMLLDKSQI
jgi:hypothetical protein